MAKQVLVLLGAAAVVAGSLLPWITFGDISVTGLSAGEHGIITLVCGLIIAAIAIWFRHVWAIIIAAAAGIFAGIWSAKDAAAILTAGQDPGFSLTIGYGLIVLGAGVLLCLVASLLAIFERRPGPAAAAAHYSYR